jgi:hypothetical protein
MEKVQEEIHIPNNNIKVHLIISALLQAINYLQNK